MPGATNRRSSPSRAPRQLYSPLLLLFSIFILAASLLIAFPRSTTTLPTSLRQFSSRIYTRILPAKYHHTCRAMASYAREEHIALLAVQRAAILTRAVYRTSAKGTVTKDDHSPVTVGDFGAQALIISALRANFPDDEIVAEEEADDLRKDEALREKVWGFVRDTRLSSEADERALGGAVKSDSDLLNVIDLGRSAGGASGRIWTLDPIDGTKGFLRGGQYAVALALLVDGDVKVGVLGCPNLPVDDTARLDASIGHDQAGDKAGVLFSAVLGEGARSRPLGEAGLNEAKSIKMSDVGDITNATFCESVEAAHSNHGDQADIARLLGITKDSVRMDSQAKYASIARGAGDIYLRLPVKKEYQEKIWDHAGGDLIVREAGGEVTDARGNRLNFSVGRTLRENKGVVAAPRAIHAKVLEAVKSVLGAKL